MTGIELIAKERQEQIEKHGRTIASDVEVNDGEELAQVASALCYPFHYADDNDDYPENWDSELVAKMVSKTKFERLIIAGALIAAEIDRLMALQNEQQFIDRDFLDNPNKLRKESDEN